MERCALSRCWRRYRSRHGLRNDWRGKTYLEKCEELGLETLERYGISRTWAWYTKFSKTEEEKRYSLGGNEGLRPRQATVANGLTISYARTDVRKYFFTERSVDRWNNLSERTRTGSQQEFKSCWDASRFKEENHSNLQETTAADDRVAEYDERPTECALLSILI